MSGRGDADSNGPDGAGRPDGAGGEPDADEEALRWEGDEPDRLDVPQPRPRARVVDVPEAPTERAPMPAVLLVVYGVFAGLYLIWTIGWVITVTRSTVTLPTVLSELMYQLGEFLAIAGPALWFAAVLLLARERAAAVRIAWLALGLVILVPWPTLLGV